MRGLKIGAPPEHLLVTMARNQPFGRCQRGLAPGGTQHVMDADEAPQQGFVLLLQQLPLPAFDAPQRGQTLQVVYAW